MKNIDTKKLEKENEFKNIRTFFLEKYELIKSNFYKSNSGFETCKNLSKETDSIITQIYEKFIFEYCVENSDLVICAVGGYGRRHLAPLLRFRPLIRSFQKK